MARKPAAPGPKVPAAIAGHGFGLGRSNSGSCKVKEKKVLEIEPDCCPPAAYILAAVTGCRTQGGHYRVEDGNRIGNGPGLAPQRVQLSAMDLQVVLKACICLLPQIRTGPWNISHNTLASCLKIKRSFTKRTSKHVGIISSSKHYFHCQDVICLVPDIAR